MLEVIGHIQAGEAADSCNENPLLHYFNFANTYRVTARRP